MRVIAISAFAISLIVAALMSQTAPRATESATASAGTAIDLTAMHQTIDMNALPEQHTSDPF